VNGWPVKKLGRVCEFKPSKRQARAMLPAESLVSFMPMNGLGIHQMYPVAAEDRPLSEVADGYTYFADGDVLLAKITPCFENGKLGVARGLTNGIGFGSSEFHVLRPSPDVSAEYVYYFLERDEVKERGAKAMTGAVGHRRVPEEFLEALEIPVPPLEEQRRIVTLLDEAFAAIATATVNAEKNLANARELFESYSEALFSDLLNAGIEPMALCDLTAPGAAITYGVVKPGGEGAVAFVRGGDLVDGAVRMDRLRTISEEFSQQYRRTLLRGGELLICLVGTPGQCAIAPKELAGANIARQVGMIRLRERVNAEYVRDYLLSSGGQRALGLKTGGSVQQVINLGDLKLIEIPLPDASKQSGIVDNLRLMKEATLLLQKLCRDKLAELAALKQSLLQRAFSGELARRVAPANDNFATLEFAANIVAFAYERHVAKNRIRNFGTVKAEKILHMVEAVGGIDLGRQPVRQPAGPDDAQHRHATWDWARSREFFGFELRSGGGHDFVKLPAYEAMIAVAQNAIEGVSPLVVNAIELMVDMDRDFAELVATTYAAWNNLILDRCTITDVAIVRAARDEWHQDKLRFDPSRFHDAIRFIRSNNFVPDGSAKRVGGQEQLAL
jgi:type I restriction enzyme S subunit